MAHRKERPGVANQLRKAVPMRRNAWDEPEPGHMEVDLVHHCGACVHRPVRINPF